MRLVSVSGTRGSGKTTLIGQLVERLTASGKRCAVIVNESGKVSHKDFPSAIRGELPLAYLRGGWVGCSLANSLVDQVKKMKRNHEPDVLFVEPSEMVVTAEMRHVCAMGRRDTDYTAGPLITLVNGPDFDFLWAERSLLISGQVRGADAVAIGQGDAVDTEREQTIRAALKDFDADPFLLSSVNGEGIERLMASIE